MALVKIIAIKSTPKNTIKYIENTEKTLNADLVTGINTLSNPDIAAVKMQRYRERYQVKNKVKGVHIVHSFSDKEKMSVEQAHEISLKWFKKVFPESAIAVAATHANTDTLHTHFYINNTCLDGTRIRTDKEWIKNSIQISNDICKSYGFENSIIENKKMIPSRSWYEYQMDQQGQSWKSKIRDDIDRLILKAKDINHLYSLLVEQGYELKLNRKYPAIRPNNKERFVRLKTLGYNYTPEQLKNRILGLDKFNLEGRAYYSVAKNNKWIDKDVYKFRYKKASIGTILQLVGKLIAVQLGTYEGNKRYYKHNVRAKKELEAIEKALNTIQSNNFESREDVVKVFNNLGDQLESINRWISKAQKKMNDVNLMADELIKLSEQQRLIKEKEMRIKEKEKELKNVLNTFDRCIKKEYESIYKNDKGIDR